MSGKDDFLGRWSRRKLEGATTPDEIDQAGTRQRPHADPEHLQNADDRSDEEILSALGLKHPDELVAGDDIKGFMQAVVPERLRRLALRQLWRANPVLANLDGLIDYGEDFTDTAMVVENMQTLYQVGKGMLRDLAEDETAEEGQDQQVCIDGPETPAEETPLEEAAGSVAPPGEAEIEQASSASEAVEAELLDVGPTRRRMAFRFGDKLRWRHSEGF